VTNARRILSGAKVLLLKHQDAGTVPIPELRVCLAELEAALDAEPVREIEVLGERADLERSDYGYPTELTRQ
jgi:hypothetical protein